MRRAVLEPKAVIAGFEDVAVMGEAIEQRGCHFRITEHAGPLAEAKVTRDTIHDPKRATIL
jgi:hypothetical protein